MTVSCPSCGSENEPSRKFCGECGSALARLCAECGTSNASNAKFCGECGERLHTDSVAARENGAPGGAERRLVSVLFVDLVGFTSASETRDAEETRELLTRYFDLARTTVERYGGVVEKFIGDAVMALWGAPVAQEDDAERAVRAALDLVAAVQTIDASLQARAGILTGEAAVTLGAQGQGMVAGDLVNTASRVQGAAPPGSVLVGESTRRASEAAVVYEDAGSHALKGKTTEMPLWRALRVVGLRRGTLRSPGVEPPFVGRDRELRLVKELFHACAENRKAHLVSVTGVAGIGKSRLAWELDKYVDGLASHVWWHTGRCLAYGDGVAFWALVEMVRGRAGILEDEPAGPALEKLRAMLEEHLPDVEERRFVEPRLGHLLGIAAAGAGDHENVFSAARMLFERLAAQAPVVLVFEDVHWADSALLDFVEYLVDWGRDLPIFVLTLARPELAERRPTWGAATRSFSSLFLEPLEHDAMDVLLTGPAPGLPEELRTRILERAEGVPFYAVETVRMLLDRGLLVREGDGYSPAGPIDTLEVPETLHALIAARLDGLSPEERRLLQHGSVLGRTFTLRGLSATTGVRAEELELLLAALIRKEMLSLSADPISPERGQYGFLQDLVRKVAYDTISRRERKTLHLAAAAHLLSLGDEEEIVEVVAAHLLDAYRAAPADPDAGDTKARARAMLVRAGERASSLGAHVEAQTAFERAAELADDPLQEAELLEDAGVAAFMGSPQSDAARRHLELSIELFEAAGAIHPGARVRARLAEVQWELGRLEDALASMNSAFEVLAREEPDEDLASLAAQLARFLFFAGNTELAAQRVETALALAEAYGLPETLSQALNTKALVLDAQGRKQEAHVLLRHALEVALEHDKPSAAMRAYYNVADLLASADRYEESATTLRAGLVHARRAGNRYWEWSLLGFGYTFFALGEWDEVLAAWAQLPDESDWRQARLAFGAALNSFVLVNVHRGRLEDAGRAVSLLAELENSADAQERAYHGSGAARLLLRLGSPAEAFALAARAFADRGLLYVGHDAIKECFVAAGEAALELGDAEAAAELVGVVEALPPGSSPQFLQAHAMRFRARLADLRGESAEADLLFRRATGLFRELMVPFYLAVTLLEQAELLAAQDPEEAAALAAEAGEVFEQLQAVPWLQRAAAARAAGASAGR